MTRLLSRFAEWTGLAALEPRHAHRDAMQAELNAEADRRLRPVCVDRALDMWALGVLEPGQTDAGPATAQADFIDDIIRNHAKGAWTWVDRYKRNGQRAWCGHFAAACYGDALPKKVRQKVLASCARLMDHGPDHGVRRISLAECRPGDVLVVKHAHGNSRTGDHITLVERIDRAAGLIHTVEGNARGHVPDGEPTEAGCREGIIRRTRPMGPATSARCPVSGLRQSSGAFAVYRMPGGDL